jgi:hypothetical protein
MVKAVSDLKNAVPDSVAIGGRAAVPASLPQGPPDGIRIERAPVGFVLRFGYTTVWLVFAGVLAVNPGITAIHHPRLCKAQPQ